MSFAKPDLSPTSPVTELQGVGDHLAKLLDKLDLKTIQDLVENIPRDFEDYTKVINISKVRPGKVTLRAKITQVRSRYSRNGLAMVQAIAVDQTGSLQLVWFNQPYIAKTIQPDKEYYISGNFAENYRYLAITNPQIELVSSFPKHTARLVPIYKLTKGLSAFRLRKIIAQALERTKLPPTLPEWLTKQHNLMPRQEALQNIHFPDNLELFKEAKRRLAFEELLAWMLASELNRRDFSSQDSQGIAIHTSELVKFSKNLGFKLTDDQRLAAWKMLEMMQNKHPINCLLQGDVGSGKTVVAVLLALNILVEGHQVALMAPTELLANQHYASIKKMLPAEYRRQLGLLTGSLPESEKKSLQQQIQSGKIKFVIGTHTLIQDKVKFANLALAIVDEQHRFGVQQRKSLQNKATKLPHVVHMSATPIPRSIALTLYGELDIISIRQKPAGRQIIQTELLNITQREDFYRQQVHQVIQNSEQVFVVAPLIEKTDSSTNKTDVLSLSKQLAKWLPEARIAILHGKLTAEQKDQIMQKFKSAEIDLLVATTVIEVGIDIPNATLMIIESADSFGLSQLHQLRGRVGRGKKASKCVLIPGQSGSHPRLKIMQTEDDGFKLAEYDLELRGPGAIYGTMQHGALDLKVASIYDTELIQIVKQSAIQFIERGEKLLQYDKLNRDVQSVRSITNLN